MSTETTVLIADQSRPAYTGTTGKFIRDIFFANLPTPFQKLRTYIWLAVLARCLGPAGFGEWSLFIVTLAVATGIASMNFGSAMMRFLSGERAVEEVNTAISTAMGAIGLSSAIAALICAAISPWGALTVFHSSPARALILIMAFALPFDCMYESVKSVLRSRRLNRQWAVVVLARLFPETVATVLVGVLLKTVNAVATTYLICGILSAASALYYLFRVRGARLVVPDWTVLARYSAFGLPLLPGTLTYFLAVNADRYIVSYYLGIKQVGIYSVCFTISVLGFFAVGSINDIMFPELSAIYDSGDMKFFSDRFRGVQKFVLVISVAAAALLVAFPGDVLHMIASRDFSSGAPTLAVLGVNGIFMTVVLMYSAVMNVRLMVWFYSWFWMITGAGIVLIDVLMLPRVGIMGAAISQLITSVLGAIVLVAWNWRLFRASFPLKWLLQNGAACATVLLVAYFWPHGGVFGAMESVARISAGSAAFVIVIFATGYLRSADLKVFADAIARR